MDITFNNVLSSFKYPFFVNNHVVPVNHTEDFKDNQLKEVRKIILHGDPNNEDNVLANRLPVKLVIANVGKDMDTHSCVYEVYNYRPPDLPIDTSTPVNITFSFPEIDNWDQKFYTCYPKAVKTGLSFEWYICIEEFHLFEIVINITNTDNDGFRNMDIVLSLKNNNHNAVSINREINSDTEFICKSDGFYWYSRFFTKLSTAIEEAKQMSKSAVTFSNKQNTIDIVLNNNIIESISTSINIEKG